MARNTGAAEPDALLVTGEDFRNPVTSETRLRRLPSVYKYGITKEGDDRDRAFFGSVMRRAVVLWNHS